MKNLQKGFMIPLTITVVSLIMALGGFYLINSKFNLGIQINDKPITLGVVKSDNLKTINLSNKGLKSIPEEIFSKVETEELDISNNLITGSIPSQIGKLTKLKILNASNNLMTGVPAEIGQLKNLEVLDLSNNQLTGLPNELANLSKLKVLNLSGNQYSKQDLDFIRIKLPSLVNIIEVSTNTELVSSLEDLKNNICNLASDCEYISYTGGCNTPEYVAKRQKEAEEQGMFIGEAPPIVGDVTCACENYKCIIQK